MIIHRTYSEEGTKTVHIPCTPHEHYYCRLVWEGNRLYRKYLSVNGITSIGRKVKVIPKETNAHS